MNLFSPKSIKTILSWHQKRPSERLGQNFLIDQSKANIIIKTADISQSDIILEIGPGMGTLTGLLASSSKRVIAIEKDSSLIPILKETLAEHSNIEIIIGNALDFDPNAHSLKKGAYKLIANIPYYITSALIRKFLEVPSAPSAILLMVQKEVAQRICAKPPEMSLLAVSVQFYAKAKVISYVSKNCFWPIPKVDSAIIHIIPFADTVTPTKATDFFKIVKAGFSQPRKQLANNLSVGLKKTRQEVEQWLKKNNISPTQRAETLTIEDWRKLTNNNSGN
jgi:16S rRNA (adenine1518-N6/adenine1519-N6)-dimethyltransferase